jgi:hypothetical protein
VSVVKGDHYDDIYDLGSSDSYGYFIVNAIQRMPEGGRVIFIVSSSFLTIKWHTKLRQFILANTKIIRVVKLNRHMFPGIDIFPVIIELERCSDEQGRQQNVYQFFDLWQLHPERDEDELKRNYEGILEDANAARPWPFAQTRTWRYTIRQGVLGTFSRVPIFEARPSLYTYMQDVFPGTVPPEVDFAGADGRICQLRVNTVRGRHVVKLSQVAKVKVGLQSGNNPKFYRAAEGVQGGAATYQRIDLRNVVSDAELAGLTLDQKSNGIRVDDPSGDRYYVPLDKSGTSDIEAGLLAMFWRPVEFYINWSESAVTEMKALRGARFQNSQFYFSRGVSFSNTGIYCPTYRLGHGGVFDQTGSCIFSDVLSPEALLGILGSTLLKYFAKSFINHGVHAQLDDLPIVLPTSDEVMLLEQKVNEIVQEQKSDPSYDYRRKLSELDRVVYDLYQINAEERAEVDSWYRRHYPKLFNAAADEE